ncbi:MAG: Ig-like domain-containing protein, partial [Anaerolinea sp.]|nr:Ig-like domain-containing protein [Anaerolinea sp.]
MRARWFFTALALLFIGLSVVVAQDQAGDPPAPGLVVTDVFPQDGSQYVVDQPIIVVFNRPVVPLITSATDPAAQVNPLIFEPALIGRGEWINSSIYQFTPDAIASGTTYRLTVDPALTSLDGRGLSAPFSSTFTTGFPRIIRFQPDADASRRALPDEPIAITFDMPVDRAAAEASLSVRADGEPVAGSITWDDSSTTMTFTPAERYPFGATVSVEVGRGVRATGGGAGATEGFEWIFAVVPLPAVVSTYPADGEQEAYPYGGITIYFASPMRIDTLRDRIRIEPEPWREGDAYYSEWDFSYTVAFPTEPSTDYTITLLPGMEDIYGNVINETTVIRYRTQPYAPELDLRAPGLGYVNAYNPRTQVFLTRRNIAAVDVSLYAVPVSTFIDALSYGEPSYNADSRRVMVNRSQLLNRWQVTSAAPENTLRYDLLDLGQAAYTPEQFCPGAPDARLMPGMQAVVSTGDEPLRLRASAPAGEIRALIDAGATVTVLSESICADGYRWYEVQTADGKTGWAAEGDQAGYYLEPAAPAEARHAASVPLQPGIYALVADQPEADLYPDVSVMVVATLNVTLKMAPEEVLAWVTDMQTGQPVAGVTIDLYRGQRSVARMVSDASGLARATVERQQDARVWTQYTAIAQADGHFGVGWTDWTDGIDGWEFGVPSDRNPYLYEVYLYSDRPIYRPGQPVYFRGIVRENDDLTYNPFAESDVRVQIIDPDNNIVFDETMRTSSFGSFEGTFDIPAGAMLGTYYLSVLTPDLEEYQTWVHNYAFAVQEYRAPEFEVTVTPERDEVAAGETIRALVNARYFFGGAVSGGTVEYTVINAPYDFNPNVPGFWSWQDNDPDAGAAEFYYFGGGEIASGTGMLNADGSFLIELPADLEDVTQSQRFTIEAVISDESGQAVAGRASVVVHKGDLYIGVQPDSAVGQANDETVVNLIAVGWDGAPVPGQPIRVEVVERRWYSVQEQDENGRTTWTYEVEEIPVTSGTVTSDSDGRASFAFVPPNGGIFKIRAATTDSAGRAIISADTICVTGNDYIPWRQQNSNR